MKKSNENLKCLLFENQWCGFKTSFTIYAKTSLHEIDFKKLNDKRM